MTQIGKTQEVRDVINDRDIPQWAQDLGTYDGCDIEAIQYGGCASGAYMPAVTYYDATQTMAERGDDVLQYLQDYLGELPSVPNDISWSGLACHYLSCAVELWCSQFEVVEDEVEA